MIYLWVILAYLLFLIAVGVYRARFLKTQADFMVAGRRLSAPILVATLLCTWIGSGSIIAGAGLSYNKGFAALWMPAGAWLGILIVYLIAGRVRKLEQFTAPDILEMRYNKWARILSTLTTIIAYTAIVSYQFRGGGYVLNVVTGIPIEQGIIITAVFVISYTALAGMLSVAYMDIFNGTVILLGIVLSFPFLLTRAGGWESVRNNLPPSHFSMLGSVSQLEALGYFLPTLFLLLGEANMYQKFFSARDERTARRAVVGWIVGTIIIETLIVAIAVVGSSMFRQIAPESIILYVARHGLPLALGCLLLAAAVAIIVSTGDSFLLTPSTNIVRDVCQRFINPKISERRVIILSRLVVVALGLFAYLQLRFFETVLQMALYAYTMYGAGITPALLAAFFWKRATAAGGVASILAGMMGTLVWEVVLKQPFGVPTIFPAIGLSVISLIVFSLATRPPRQEQWKPFLS